MIYKCYKCGAENKIVNQCGCDAQNMPTTPKLKLTDNVVYDPDNWNVLDFYMSDGRTNINRLTHAEMEAREGKVLGIGHWETVHNLREKDFISPPVEITADRWDEMLNVLPPMKWRSGGGAQTFMMCEFTYGIITTIFINRGDKYYELSDKATLTHDEIMEKLAA
mgnify:CR=1 FL=1